MTTSSASLPPLSSLRRRRKSPSSPSFGKLTPKTTMCCNSSTRYPILTFTPSSSINLIIISVILAILTGSVSGVNVPAHFIQKYSLYTVRRGDPAILTCEAFGSPPISIRWLKQDVKTGVAIPLRIPIFGTTEFDVFGNDQFDIGKTDLGARTAFDNSRRNINADDDITISDNNNINNLDDDITSSSRWNAFQRDFPISRIQEEEERTVFELHISTTEMKDSAVYTCRISNEYGDDVRNMELTIFDVPSPPENITIDGVWSTGVSLTWSPSRHDGNSLITEYIIQYWKESPPLTLTLTTSSSSSYSSPTGTLSSSNTTRSSSTSYMSSHRPYPPHPPHLSPLHLMSSRTSFLPFSPFSSSSSTSTTTNSRMSEEEVSSSVSSHVIRDNLSSGTFYTLRMLGKNSVGRGPPSAPVRFTTTTS